jgi:hypothetical protein
VELAVAGFACEVGNQIALSETHFEHVLQARFDFE